MSLVCADPLKPVSGKLEQDGFLAVRGLFRREAVSEILPDLEGRIAPGSAGTRTGLLDFGPVRDWLQSSRLQAVLEQVGFHDGIPTRVILFDMTPEANWGVPWHQDLAIRVRRRRDVPGFQGWLVKQGMPHVHPPASVLEEMITLRIALDACGPENGPLTVPPGTHRWGRLDAGAIEHWKRTVLPFECTAGAGDALWMRPLLLHASSPARVPTRRRVLHVEWARQPLPGGLEWDSFPP